MARVFVTGGSGFIGAHLLRALVERGDQVTCVSRTAPFLDGEPASFEWIRADLHDTSEYVGTLASAEYVIHLASLLTARRRADYLHTNVEGTRALLDACLSAGQGIRCFLHMSSIAAIGPTEDGSLLTEATPCRPRTEYGASKLAAEQLLREAKIEWPVVILRPSFVYGIGDVRGATFLRELLDARPCASRLTVSTISFCHVSDIVRACLLALDVEPKAGGQTYLIAEPKPYTWQDVDAIVERALRRLAASGGGGPAGRLLVGLRQAQSHAVVSRNGEHWGCDTRRAAQELGFRAVCSLGEAAEDLIRSYLQAHSLFPHRGGAVAMEA